MEYYKCKCKNGWKLTKPGSLVEIMCMICNGTGKVDYDTAISYGISVKPKNKIIEKENKKKEK